MPVEALQLEPTRNAVLAAGIEAPSIPQIAREHIVSLAKLVVEYALQPIVEINTGHVYGYEALMRGFDRLNLTSPTQLLDHAARSGSIVALEKLLLKRAIAKFASTTDVAGKRLFLNLDGRTLGDNDELRALIVDAVKGHRIFTVHHLRRAVGALQQRCGARFRRDRQAPAQHGRAHRDRRLRDRLLRDEDAVRLRHRLRQDRRTFHPRHGGKSP